MSVIVPTVECDPPPSRFWSTITAILRFSMASASGCGYRGKKFRTNMLKFSKSCLCASVATVSKTIEDLPEPETPVKMVIFRFGILSDTFFRLFSRPPRISMYSDTFHLPREWPMRFRGYRANGAKVKRTERPEGAEFG